MTVPASSPPHFIGIGAQHAGTSWLHECLKKHPQLWLPPEKELHYFDRSPKYPSPSHLAPDQPLLRFLGNDAGNKLFKLRVKAVVKDNLNNPDVLSWYLKYFLLPASDQWYLSLFERGRGKIAGECSPSYAMLELEDVQKIGRLLPNIKVIFILRNPIDRTWSQFRHRIRLRQIDPNISLKEFKEWTDLPSVASRSNYLKTLSIWSSVFKEEQIYIGFYDQISSEPQKFLAGVLDFLGVASDAVTVQSIHKKNV
jgi:Sulfotransferase domain.